MLGDPWLYPTSEDSPLVIRVPGGLFQVPTDRAVSRVARLQADRAVAFGVRAERCGVSSDSIAHWADILSAVPGSVLVVDATRLGGAPAFAEIKAQLARHGLSGRLRQHGRAGDGLEAPWAAAIDIVLDAGSSAGLDDVLSALAQGQIGRAHV